jgi:hypothetical protein
MGGLGGGIDKTGGHRDVFDLYMKRPDASMALTGYNARANSNDGSIKNLPDPTRFFVTDGRA